MPTSETVSDRDASSRVELAAGMVLVSPTGQVRILRSRTADDAGWNCSDGAAIDDDTANDPSSWNAYTPEQLAADLRVARELGAIAGHRMMSGGLATWDACSGRPCQLPKIARLVD
ncbi:MAG TPA: hypothetical protein VK860_09305 [Ilumatobacteraceae bacterium]|nr:hypothetical protein [Ilumatobacteraceae bacterium]